MSANRRKIRTKNGHTIGNPEYLRWKQAAHLQIISKVNREGWEPRITPVRADVIIMRNRDEGDADNFIKAIFDAAQGKRGIYVNDKQIKEHRVRFMLHKMIKREGIYLAVTDHDQKDMVNGLWEKMFLGNRYPEAYKTFYRPQDRGK